MPIGTTTRRSEPYFDWLCERVERRGQVRDFKAFLRDLNEIEFYSLIPNDDNRGFDGLRYRDAFSDLTGGFFVPSGPCSVFEMLVGLADRLAFILYELNNEDRQAKWFWVLIENLRLEEYHMGNPDILRKKRDNREKIDIFLARRYMDTGQGGLFPLKNPLKDQRDTELWYQMMYWLEENYQI